MKHKKKLKFKNDRKWPKKLPIKYAFLYLQGYEQGLYVGKVYLWYTTENMTCHQYSGPSDYQDFKETYSSKSW